MRDPLRTRRLLARVDRSEDVYVVLDRIRQAFHDIDDMCGRLEERIHALETEKASFQTESGVHRIIESTVAKEAFDWVKWATRGVLGVIGSAAIVYVFRLIWSALHA
jgi:hypothetical protein